MASHRTWQEFLGTMLRTVRRRKENDTILVNINFLTDVQIDHVHLKGDCFLGAVSCKRLSD